MFGIHVPTIQDLVNAFHAVTGFLGIDFVTNTPVNYTYGVAGVQGLWQVLLVISNMLLVAVFLRGGLRIMLGRVTGDIYTTPQALVARIFTCAVGMNFSFFICHQAIDFENTLSDTLQAFIAVLVAHQVGHNVGNIIGVFVTTIVAADATDGAALIPLAVLIIVMLVVYVMLYWQMLGRLIMLDILLIFMAPAFLLLMQEETQEYGAFLIRTFFVTLFSQVVQVVAFGVAIMLLTTLVTLGNGNAITLYSMGITAFIMILRIPSFLSQVGGYQHRGGAMQAIINAGLLAMRFL